MSILNKVDTKSSYKLLLQEPLLVPNSRITWHLKSPFHLYFYICILHFFHTYYGLSTKHFTIVAFRSKDFTKDPVPFLKNVSNRNGMKKGLAHLSRPLGLHYSNRIFGEFFLLINYSKDS